MAYEEPMLAYRPANTMREFRQLRDNPNVRIIRSRDDWKAYLSSDESVCKGVPKKVLKEFTNSLHINGGLGAMRYGELQNNLTFRQFRDLLHRFGIDLGLFVDYDGYYCSGKGTCSTSATSICIGENC